MNKNDELGKVESKEVKAEIKEEKAEAKKRRKEEKRKEKEEKKELEEEEKMSGRTAKAIMGTLIVAFISVIVYLFFHLGLIAIVYLLGLAGIRTESIFFFGVISGIILSPIIAFLIAYFKLARRDVCFTFVREATAKAVMKGGEVAEILMRYQGYTLDQNGEVKEAEDLPKHLFGGFVYFGLPPIKDIHVYKFIWTGVKENGEVEYHKREALDYIILKQDVYYAKLEKAEDKNALPLTVELLFTLQIVNPYKALFKVENWLEAVLNRSLPIAREVVTNRSFEDWLKHQEEGGNIILEKIKAEGMWKEFIDEYGTKIVDIGLKQIDPPKEYRDTTLLKYTAEKEKEARITEAEGIREKKKIEADGEKEAIEKIYSTIEKSKDRLLIKTLETIEKSPQQGSKWILSFPHAAETLSNVLGKSSGTDPNEVLKLLPIIIEELQKISKKDQDKPKKDQEKSDESKDEKNQEETNK